MTDWNAVVRQIAKYVRVTPPRGTLEIEVRVCHEDAWELRAVWSVVRDGRVLEFRVGRAHLQASELARLNGHEAALVDLVRDRILLAIAQLDMDRPIFRIGTRSPKRLQRGTRVANRTQ